MEFGQEKLTSPIKKYLSWKGSAENGFFEFYDKELKKAEKYDLTEFIVLKTGFTVKGWNDDKEASIFSNEVYDLRTEEFRVRVSKNEKKDFKGGSVAEGLYSDIKANILSSGGKLNMTVIALHNGELIEFFLKGLAFAQFSEFTKTINTSKFKVKLDGFTEGKKGAVKFRMPKWSIGKDITEKERAEAIKALNEFKEFVEVKKAERLKTAEEIEKEEYEAETEELHGFSEDELEDPIEKSKKDAEGKMPF